jgi:hypothetical protein
VAELSLKGIARRFLGLNGSFSVRNDLLSNTSGFDSLGTFLLSKCALKVQNAIPDCGFTINQAYDQFWTHIIVRVKVVAHNVANLPTSLDLWKGYWKMGIEAIWNRQIPSSFPPGIFHKDMETAQQSWSQVEEDAKQQSGDPNYWSKGWVCRRNGESPCRLRFEVQWVESSEHHVIQVGDVASAPGGSDESTWVLLPTGAGLTLTGAAHEYGHMLGFSHDRIPPNGCEVETAVARNKFSESPNLPDFPWRRTVMCAISVYGQLPSHLVAPFANNIGSSIEQT